ncbi:MAG: hypothetical protein ABS69_01785 [Nitrosomonadales bacterium SCN 54-20]|nr:MAG: hypothetical protein ABS69_01785 [Nitrosomonadales bacterium SCN 54-20]
MLIVLVGARGAGKSTLQDSLRSSGVRVLQPSTTRSERGRDDKEYDFVTGWDASLYAWSILVGTQTYGMRTSELSHAENEICITVFEPTQLSVFEDVRKSFPFDTMTVGLDTIADLAEQHARVGADSSRQMNANSFEQAKNTVMSCDMVLHGEVATVQAAIKVCLSLIAGRGGVVTKEDLRPLIASGTILDRADPANLRSASYDLRVGDELWCQGSVIELSDTSPRFLIPPYSYAIVSALEIAKLPPFIVGRFDLRVSYFLEGIILSNGPQVDPGYKGALFCMLYNGSSKPKLITRGRHFATMDFTTTTRVTEAYKQKYQFQQRMERFMTDDTIVARGGAIVELIDEKVAVVHRKIKAINVSFWAIAAAVISVVIVPTTVTLPYLWGQLSDVQDVREELNNKISEADRILLQMRHEVETLNRKAIELDARGDQQSKLSAKKQ